MIARLIAGLTFVVIAACGGSQSPPPGPSPSPGPSPAPAAPSSAMTPEECTQQGGELRGDIGDGQIACAEGERELGRVALGIEGSVCCAPDAPAEGS